MKGPSPRDLEEYLCLAMTDANLLRAPYDVRARTILQSMHWLRERLAADAHHRACDDVVSVILATYNRGNVLRRAVLSVLLQSAREVELIIVDDGSTDDTPDIVAGIGDARVRYVRSDSNAGAAAARNMGLRAARGRYVSYLDSDDWWHPDFVLIMRGELQRTGHRFNYSAQRVLKAPDGSQPRHQRHEHIRFAPYNAGLLENGNFISQIAVMHERDLGLEVGGFDEGLRRYVDWDFFLRLAEVSPPLAVPVILSHYDQATSGSVSTTMDAETARGRILDGLASERFSLQPTLRRETRDAPGVMKEDKSAASDTHRAAWHGLRRSPTSRPLERPTTILVAAGDAAPALQHTLESLARFTSPGCQVLLVVGRLLPPVRLVVEAFASRLDINTVSVANPVSALDAVDHGSAAADPVSDLALLSPGTVVTRGWLQELSRIGHRYPDVGLVVPRQVVLANDARRQQHVPGALPSAEIDVALCAAGRNVLDPFFDTREAVTELRSANLECVLVTREALDVVGPPGRLLGSMQTRDQVYAHAVRIFAGRRILHAPRAKIYLPTDRHG